MATPINPLFTNEEMIARLLQQYPTHTRESVIEEARAYGFDLDNPQPPRVIAPETKTAAVVAAVNPRKRRAR